MRYKVSLTKNALVKSYQHITSYQIWKEDPDYFIFFWSNDKTEIIIKKEYVISIEKYNN